MASAALILQRAFYIGNIFGGILYGVQLILCFQSLYYLKRSSQPRTSFYMVFSLFLLFLSTIGFGINALYGQFVWIERGPNTPGGPIAYFAENTTWWVNTFGTSANVVTDFMSQCLLLYRCYIVMGGKLMVLVLPTLMFLASTALAIVSTIEAALPNHFLLSGVPANFGVPWIAISVSFNIVVTGIISSRLIYAHHQMKNISLPTDGQTFTGVTAILVESALPLAIFGIIFAVFYGKNSPVAICFAVIWGAFVAISPQLIILRVAMGVAWSKTTMVKASGIEFSPPAHTKSTDVEEGQTRADKTLSGAAGALKKLNGGSSVTSTKGDF